MKSHSTSLTLMTASLFPVFTTILVPSSLINPLCQPGERVYNNSHGRSFFVTLYLILMSP
jgi:hypothetical protein